MSKLTSLISLVGFIVLTTPSVFAYPQGPVPSNASNSKYNSFLYQEFMTAVAARFGSVSLGECDAAQLADDQACYFYSNGEECSGRFLSSSASHYYPDQIGFSCGGKSIVINRGAKNIAISRQFLNSLGLAYPGQAGERINGYSEYTPRGRSIGSRRGPFQPDYCNYAYNNGYPIPRGCY